MLVLAGLIRQFPEGSFFLLLALIAGIARVGVAFANRNRPITNCNCDCCDHDDDEEEE